MPCNLKSGRGSSLKGVVDERASNHCSKSSFCNASRSGPLHSAYKPRFRDSRANRCISLSVNFIVQPLQGVLGNPPEFSQLIEEGTTRTRRGRTHSPPPPR